MIHFDLEIKNPLERILKIQFGSLFPHLNIKITKNKSFEFDSYIDPSILFKILIDTNFTGKDHAGPCLELTFLTFTIAPKIYDHRHWNFSKNRWYLPGEEAEEENNEQ